MACGSQTNKQQQQQQQQQQGLQNEKISFVVVARDYPTVYRHPR
jgi:hypothetical protein